MFPFKLRCPRVRWLTAAYNHYRCPGQLINNAFFLLSDVDGRDLFKGPGLCQGLIKVTASCWGASVCALIVTSHDSHPPPLAQVTKHASVSSQEVNVALMLLWLLLMSIGMRKEENTGLFPQFPPHPRMGASPLPHPSAEASRDLGLGLQGMPGP